MNNIQAKLSTLVVCTGFLASPIITPAQERLLVAHDAFGDVRSFSSSGADLGLFATSVGRPIGLAADADDNIYVSSFNGNAIQKFALDGTDLGFFATSSSGLNGPLGMAFDDAGNLFVANYYGPILKLSPGGGSEVFATLGVGLGATALTFDSSGNLYASVTVNNLGVDPNGTVRKFAADGTDLGVFASSLVNPYGLVFDANGDLLVAAFQGGNIRKISAAGTDLGDFATGLNLPVGLVFDPTGDLLVSEYGAGRIHKYSADGTDLGQFAATSLQPTAILWIPEPRISALLALAGGFCLLVCAKRRTAS